MKKTMLKAVTLTATAAMLMGTLSFTATGVLAGEKYPVIATYNELDTTQSGVYDKSEVLTPESNVSEEVQEEVQTDTYDLETVTPDVPELDKDNAQMSGKWGTCDWNIDDDGVLTISGGVGGHANPDNFSVWYKYSNEIKKINIEDKITFEKNPEGVLNNLNCLFRDLKNLEEINGLENLDISNIDTIIGMFKGCASLKSLDVSSFNTSNVGRMNGVFSGCSSLTSLDVSNFDTSNVGDMLGMFAGCSNLTSLDLSNFDLSGIGGFDSITYIKGFFSDTVKEVTMPNNFGSIRKEYIIRDVIECMGDVSWTDKTANVKYDGKPDTLIEGHRYVVTGSTYDKADDADNTNKDNTGKDDSNNNNVNKDDSNKNNSNNTNKDNSDKNNSNNTNNDANKNNNNSSNNANNVAANKNGVLQGEDGNWYYYVNGDVNTGYNGLAANEAGWWKITNGMVDFGFNGLAYDEKVGWWKVVNGAIDFSYTGLVYDENVGWWKVVNGAIDFGYTGLAYDENVGWWYVSNGAIDFTYTGTAANEYGTWNVVGGQLVF